MEKISLSYEKALTDAQVQSVAAEALAAQKTLHAGNGKGNDFLGWLHLPSSITPEFLDEVEQVAANVGIRFYELSTMCFCTVSGALIRRGGSL